MTQKHDDPKKGNETHGAHAASTPTEEHQGQHSVTITETKLEEEKLPLSKQTQEEQTAGKERAAYWADYEAKKKATEEAEKKERAKAQGKELAKDVDGNPDTSVEEGTEMYPVNPSPPMPPFTEEPPEVKPQELQKEQMAEAAKNEAAKKEAAKTETHKPKK